MYYVIIAGPGWNSNAVVEIATPSSCDNCPVNTVGVVDSVP